MAVAAPVLDDSRYVVVADKAVEYLRLERGQLSRGTLAGLAAKSVAMLPVAFELRKLGRRMACRIK